MTAASSGTATFSVWPRSAERVRVAGLLGGIAASMLYGAMMAFIGFEHYSPITHTVSELSAVGAPTRGLWITLGSGYMALLTAFGWSVTASAGPRRSLTVAGIALAAFALPGLLWPFAPMHQREVLAAGGGTLADTFHLILGGMSVALMLASVGFGGTAFGRSFRGYSAATIATVLVFGILTALEAPAVPANLPTPWIGLFERINIGAFLAWVVVLAVILLREAISTHPTAPRTLRSPS